MKYQEYYTVREIANMVGVVEETVRRWIYKDKLKVEPIRSKKEGYRVPYVEAIRFIQAHSKYSRTWPYESLDAIIKHIDDLDIEIGRLTEERDELIRTKDLMQKVES